MTEFTLSILKVIITSFVAAFIIFNFMERIFKRRYHQKRLYVSGFVISCCLFFLSAVFANGIISIAITVAVTFITAFYLYNAQKSSDVLIICLFLIFVMLTEIVGQIIVSFISTDPLSISHGDILQSTITFTCYQLVMYFITKQKREFNNAGNWITLVVIPAISIFQITVFVYLLKDQTNNNNKLLVLCACLSIFAVNVIIYVLFERIAKLNFEKTQFQLLEQQRQAQYKYFNELEQNYQESRKFFHDIKNHLNVMEELYKNNDSSNAEYAETLRLDMDKLAVQVPSRNRIINVLIQKWLSEAAKQNISFNYQCEDVDLSFISDRDLVTILTNLFDNAFEECAANGKKDNFIDFSLCQINNFVVIQLFNSSHSDLNLESEPLRSSKENHLGLGLTNVRVTVEKYQGMVDIKQENQVFTVQLTFFGHH